MSTSSWAWPERYTGELCLNVAHPRLAYRGYRAIWPTSQIERTIESERLRAELLAPAPERARRWRSMTSREVVEELIGV